MTVPIAVSLASVALALFLGAWKLWEYLKRRRAERELHEMAAERLLYGCSFFRVIRNRKGAAVGFRRIAVEDLMYFVAPKEVEPEPPTPTTSN